MYGKTSLRITALGSLITLALALAAPTPGWTQALPAPGQEKSMPISKVERKNRAPVSKEILRVKLPKPMETTLTNGLSVLILEDHRLPTVSMQLSISGAGPIFEPSGMSGLASVTAQMLREGTKTRTSKQIAEEIEQLGANLFASAGFGSSATVMTASGLSDNLDQWFELATDVLLHPVFPGEELAKLKERLKVQVRQQRSFSGFLVSERFSRAVFGDHPAAVRSATLESIEAFAPEALAKWRRERYAPQNAILGIAGDVRASEMIQRLKKWQVEWKNTEGKEELPPNPRPAASKKIYLVHRPGSVQTDVAMGNIAIDRRDPDYVPLVVMDRIVGGGASARLFLNLRENKGYTYGVYSGFTALKYPGPWQAGGNMRTEVTDGAMTEFFSELRRIREEKVPEAELDEAKRSVVAGFALSLEQPTQLLSYAIVRKIYGFREDYWDTYPTKIIAVTAEDVQRIARKYINLDAIQVAAVGDASKIKTVLEKYGPVEVYDTEGRPAAVKSGPSNP